MGIDRLTTLAFSLYSNKGAYALLLGAGISRPAHIPSAWDIENALIERIAAIKGVVNQENWHAWYEREFSTKASYSSLLSELVATKTERVQLMKDFFEATDEEKEKGWKKPTRAHRGIANLAKHGYLRVILTTNFDRLIEEALADEGVTYQVVLDESDLDKITPITHATIPTIVKINGDYIDCRFRNTETELTTYPIRLKEFLQRIFSEFGLITCGWSAKWDRGLMSIITTSRDVRYNSFFTYLKGKDDAPTELASKRNGETLAITDADTLMGNISEQVEALARINVSQKLGQEMVVERVKRYLSSKEYDIQYADLVDDLISTAVEAIMAKADYRQSMTPDLFAYYQDYHHQAVETLIDVTIVVCRWGKDYHLKQIGEGLVKFCIKPFVNGTVISGHSNYVHGLAGTYLFNAMGMACVYYGRFKELDGLFELSVPAENFFDIYRHSLPYMIGISHWSQEEMNWLIGRNYLFPYSFMVKDEIRSHFRKIFILDSDYDTAFYIWEHLKSLLFLHHKCYFLDLVQIPIGNYLRFKADERFRHSDGPYCSFFDAADKLKNEWAPIKQGMFDGQYDVFKKVYAEAEEYCKGIARG